MTPSSPPVRIAKRVLVPLLAGHRFPGLPRPLRWVAGAVAESQDRALARWAAGVPHVSHGRMALEVNRRTMAIDGFHPGEPVYREVAERLAEQIAGAVWPGLAQVAAGAGGITPPAPAAASPQLGQ